MVEASRLELGCVSYDFYVGLADPNTLMLFQEWESLDALQSHFETKHMDEFLQQLPDILAGEVVTKRYAVQSIEEEEAVLIEAEEPIIHWVDKLRSFDRKANIRQHHKAELASQVDTFALTLRFK